LLQQKRVLEVEWLAGYNELKRVVEPFPKGMDKAGTVQADRVSAEGTLVDFYSEIKIPKRIEVILLNPIPNVCSSILGKVTAHLVLPRSNVNLHEKIKRCGLSFLSAFLDISIGIQ
jgi:hypothetical protein